MSESLALAGMIFGVFLILLGAISVFLPRDACATTTTKAELERVKREAERRFEEENR